MPTGFPTIVKQGCFDADVANAINAITAATPNIVTTNQNAALAFGGFNAAITLLPSGHAAGSYRVSVYGVVTTTITVATSWALTAGYTDDQGARTFTVSTSSTMTAGAAEGGSTVVRSTGATALTITLTAASAGAGVVAYSVVVERVI